MEERCRMKEEREMEKKNEMEETQRARNRQDTCGGEKVDLHLHLDGSLSPELVERFLRESGEARDSRELKEMLTVPADCKSLVEYLQRFELPLKVLQGERQLEMATEELAERLGRQGLTYGEIRFAPQLHGERGMTQQQAVEAVLAGMKRGLERSPGLELGILLCMMVTGDPAANEETVELAGAYGGKGVVGLDLAGAEGAVPMESFRPLFEKAGRMGTPFTIHAGECGDAENIKKAVSFGTARIGHGCAAIKDRACMELLRRENIVLEMCPISNLQTKAVKSIQEHPIRRFFEYGIRVTVNTDNMTVSQTNLDREYALLEKELGFTREEIGKMNQDARAAGFLK